jgi:hypothetical protein
MIKKMFYQTVLNHFIQWAIVDASDIVYVFCEFAVGYNIFGMVRGRVSDAF